MGQPVEQGASKALVAEGGGPFVEGQVRSDDGGAAFVPLADQLKQQLGARLGERHEAEFIDDQELDGRQLLLQAQQTPLVPGLDHLMHDGRRGDETGLDPVLAGGEPKGDGDMRLADARGTERDDVLPAADELASGQIEDQLLVEGWDCIEVEALKAFDRREAGRLDAPVDHAGLPVQKLQLDQAGQIPDMVDVLRRALSGDLLVLSEHGRQLQLLEVMLKQDLRRFAGGAHTQVPEVSAI